MIEIDWLKSPKDHSQQLCQKHYIPCKYVSAQPLPKELLILAVRDTPGARAPD
jgi:hypothetical protein